MADVILVPYTKIFLGIRCPFAAVFPLWYFVHPAAITSKLVQAAMTELGEPPAGPRRRCILMGHSMGCITAATAAIDPSLPADQTTLVLVAPALSLPSSLRKATAEQRRASGRRMARAAEAGGPGGPAALSEPLVGSDDNVLRGGSGGGSSRRAGARRSAGSSRRIFGGVGGVVRAVVGAPVSAAETVLHAAVWVFNWCLLPMIYPLEILGLRCVEGERDRESREHAKVYQPTGWFLQLFGMRLQQRVQCPACYICRVGITRSSAKLCGFVFGVCRRLRLAHPCQDWTAPAACPLAHVVAEWSGTCSGRTFTA